jgi:malate dehydrogenase
MVSFAQVHVHDLLPPSPHLCDPSSMDISIIGAAGSVGRQIAIGLIRQGLLSRNSRLQLVGHKGGLSEQSLPGIATDLTDAFAEDLPEIDLAYGPQEVLGDIIILAAGDAVGRGDMRSRADLAKNNQPLVESYARAIARHGHGEELLLVLTNPVESSVDLCCRHLDRKRVIGMGAYLDSLRFRQEIAADLGVQRQRVQGLVLGEHGPRMVPCWSTVDVHGFESSDGRARLSALRSPKDPSVPDAIAMISRAVQTKGSAAAYALASRMGPALRTVVKPYVTQFSGARSPASTAEMILRLLGALLSGGQVLTAAQIRLEGEFLDLRGVVGAPIVLTLNGVDRVVPYALSVEEQAQVRTSVLRSRARGHASTSQSELEAERARRWRCELMVQSGARPGNAERVSAVFASRGISLDTMQAWPGSPAKIGMSFVASTRIKDHVARRLKRLSGVLSVSCSPMSRSAPTATRAKRRPRAQPK